MAFDGHLIRLNLPSTFELLDIVQVLSDRISGMAGLDEDATHWVSVAVRESVINAIKHGNREDRDKHVTIEFLLMPRAKPEQFVVEVLDEGEGFNPDDIADPLDPQNVLKSSGRGIFFMRNFMDELRGRFPGWDAKLGEDHLIDLGVLGEISETALTREREIAFEASGLPSTFVPGRNLVFLTMAGAVAYRRGLRRIVGGMCETDYSGYPDCRDDTVKAMQVALNLGMQRRFVLETPLMWRDKAETWALAERLGGASLVDLILEKTHTCYRGERGQRHEWGYGCGTCPACALRAAGWQRWSQRRSHHGSVQRD